MARYFYEHFHEFNVEFMPEDTESFDKLEDVTENISIFVMRFKPKGPVSGREVQAATLYLDLGSDTYACVGVDVD